jgi:hypothetical protein
MPRRDNPTIPGQQLEPWPLRREPFASVQEQEWATLAAFQQLQGRIRDRYRLGHLIFPVVGPSMRSIIVDACGGLQKALNRARRAQGAVRQLMTAATLGVDITEFPYLSSEAALTVRRLDLQRIGEFRYNLKPRVADALF